MRPSSISFSSVMRAISRRMPSKDESTTAFGVSSMMKSTPVRCSSARMFRPSRPMMRPFMSSDGNSTRVTVVSAACEAATRWSASATRFRARRFGPGLLLHLAHLACELVADQVLRALEQVVLRLGHGHPGQPLELAQLVLLRLLQLGVEPLGRLLPVCEPLVPARELDELLLELVLLRLEALLGACDLAPPLLDLRLDLR